MNTLTVIHLSADEISALLQRLNLKVTEFVYYAKNVWECGYTEHRICYRIGNTTFGAKVLADNTLKILVEKGKF